MAKLVQRKIESFCQEQNRRMIRLISAMLLLLLCSRCSKVDSSDSSRVDIYLLKSFSRVLDTSRRIGLTTIGEPVLDDKPIVRNSQVLFYEQLSSSFKLSTDIKPILETLGPDQGFAITVDGRPVYFGIFHPAYLSSILYGSATINPSEIVNNKLKVDFAYMDNFPFLQSYDKRNDPKILQAFKKSGRLR